MTGTEISIQVFTEAATLMFVGMGFVFAFLSLLIIVIKLVIAPLARKFPDNISQKHETSNSTENPALIAAISVAVNQYRKKHN